MQEQRRGPEEPTAVVLVDNDPLRNELADRVLRVSSRRGRRRGEERHVHGHKSLNRER